MAGERPVSSVAIDLTRMHRRTVSSFYSHLVTRPTGRAIRMGVESQLAEMGRGDGVCLSILDFSQVGVLDYSCADEIVAKLLLRYAGPDRPGEAYFLGRGLQEHHREAVEAVLERHGLLLVAHDPGAEPALLGPTDPVDRACWAALARRGSATRRELTADTGLPDGAVAATLSAFCARRVALPAGPDAAHALPYLDRD